MAKAKTAENQKKTSNSNSKTAKLASTKAAQKKSKTKVIPKGKTRKPKVEKTISLESILMNCRNALRGKIGGNDTNRDAVMTLTFLKFVGDKFEKRRKEIEEKYAKDKEYCKIQVETVAQYISENVFYIPKHARWSNIVENASKNEIAVILDKALKDIQEKNPALSGALPTNFYTTNLGGLTKELKKLIDEVNRIDETQFVDKDLIGRVYEYFLQAFSIDSTGKENGEFYTPANIVELITELIEPYDGVVYDPCCGSGGMFVQSIKFVERHQGNKKKISVRGQESNPDTWRLAILNLAIRGISHDLGTKAVSTFSEDLHTADKHRDHPFADFIMANPPFNLKGWRGENELLTDPRWYPAYQIPPVSNANYAWILHMLSKLDTQNGIAGFLLANGALNAGKGKEGEKDEVEFEIRKQLIDNDKIEAIIVLPRDMFYSVDLSTTLWILNNNKKAHERNGRKLRDRRNEILFIDLRRWDENIMKDNNGSGGSTKFVILSEEQIVKVRHIYFSWQTDIDYTDIDELCMSATLEQIKTQKYSLAPSKYIKFVDRDLDIDYETEMKRIQAEMKDILTVEVKSQDLLKTAFDGIGYGIN